MSDSRDKSGSRRFNKKTDAFKAMCRNYKLKITPQRMAVYKVLSRSQNHPSAESVYKKVRKILPNISLDTVNRTLLTLNRIGAAFIVEGSGDVKRFDAGLEIHQHFKCTKCKRIIDFHHKPFDNINVPRAIANKFKVLKTTVYLEGICDKCLKKKSS